ncbi:ABC transporter permease [Paenibacillus rhizophilus]|uniref:Iron ABC transporter permease n=1 Tax=Paenibacillus rhizophilus TaxID=1850366 RepID=A0A3N9P4T8_9BACL|nr:iron ABC transporter permease [Paenibacillus rhizophilus]RQW11198.1 iron ABC transporter permease [Paenibacillus rhizophilus]
MKKSAAQRLLRIGPGGLLLRAGLLWVIFALLIYPNLNMITSIFYQDGHFTAEIIGKLFSSERAIRSLVNSFILAISMVVTVNIVGILLVLFTEYLDIKGASFLKLGYLSTLIYGGIVLSTSYKFVYGSNGMVTNLLLRFVPDMNTQWFTGYGAVLFVMTFACTSNHIIFLTNAIRGIDYQTVEAAKNMGASSLKIFIRVVLPTLKPTLFAVTILTFITGLDAMSAPLVLGGPNFQTINPVIMTFAKSSYSQDIAALLAVILGIATVLLLAIMNKFEKNGNYISISKVKSKIQKQKISNPTLNIIVHALAYLLFLIYVVPIALVILYSFSNSQAIRSGSLNLNDLTMDNYFNIFTSAEAFRPFTISMIYSLSAAILVVILTLIASRIVHKDKSKVTMVYEYGMLIPWLLPGTLIALGLMTTYDSPQFIMFNHVLIGTSTIMLIAYIIIKIPFSLRMIKSSFASVDTSLEEAARSMGASPLYTMLKVILPVILPTLLSVMTLNFNSLLSEYDLTVLLYHPLMQPLGPVIKAASDESASINAQVMLFVYSVLLMLISSLALWLVYGKKLSFKNRKY